MAKISLGILIVVLLAMSWATYQRVNGPKRWTSQQFAIDAFNEARAAAERGDAAAQGQLGLYYRLGFGVRGDIREAQKWMQKGADQGDAKSQWLLGSLYRSGGKKEYEQAVKWYRASALQGYKEAQYSLGHMYRSGYGVTRDYAEALRLFRVSAEQGYHPSENAIGEMYEKGHGVPQSYSEALKRYRSVAELGLARAQFNLGVLYAEGLGVPQNDVYAYMWLSVAARGAYPSPSNKEASEIRNRLAKRMTKEQLGEAKEMASQQWELVRARRMGRK